MMRPPVVPRRLGNPAIFISLLVLLAALLLVAEPASARANNCPDVIFIGAAGSGELDHSASVVREYDSMGPEVDDVWAGVRENLLFVGMSERSSPIVYPADSTNELRPTAGQLIGLAGGPVAKASALNSWRQGNLGRYLRSIDLGVSDTISVVKNDVAACASSRLVLSGYSQGAMVMHQAELALKAQGRTDLLNHIGGTILVADGDRASHSQARLFGSASPKGRGVRAYLHQADVPLPGSSANICSDGDLVCDFGIRHLLHAHQGIKVHKSYAPQNDEGQATSYSPLLGNASDWLGERLMKPYVVCERTHFGPYLAGKNISCDGARKVEAEYSRISQNCAFGQCTITMAGWRCRPYITNEEMFTQGDRRIFLQTYE